MTAVLLLALVALVPATSDAQTAGSEAIRLKIEQLMFDGELRVDGVPILTREVMVELYAGRDYEPLWAGGEQVAGLEALAREAYEEGLDLNDYPLDALRRLRDVPVDAESVQAADLDILMTETLLRILYQMRFGKVEPTGLFSEWNFRRTLQEGTERNRVIEQIIAGESLLEGTRSILDRGPLYRLLVQALARYRGIAASGGWSVVPEGPTLRSGDRDPRVATLRARLSAEGDLEATDPDDLALFDASIETAVMRFQHRHGLDPDGVVGARTIAAVNVPVNHRIDQLRASLERGRWVMEEFRTIGDRFVLVNIASAELALMESHKPVFLARVQVGRPYRQTPVFRDDIQYLVVNPTWTVPPTILRKDVLPKLLADPQAYLARNHMDLLDRSGSRVDPAAVDFTALSASGFPYMLRQRPGPWNSLGQVKFIFPNPYFIFLHDTPHREYFDQAERAMSSGCIRVENPFALAKLLLDDPGRWNDESFRALLETEQERVVYLDKTVPVFLLYWTGMADPDGTVRFYDDIYDRDARLLAAMAKPPRVVLPPGR